MDDKIKLISVDEDIFNLTAESESIEGFSFQESNVKNKDKGLDEIDDKIVNDFLQCPTTKVFIAVSDKGPTKLIAHNYISNETIEISDLGNHILAMNEVLLTALIKRKELKSNPKCEIINDDFICSINATLFKGREGEVGIGTYRDYTYLGNPCDVVIIRTNPDGKVVLIDEWQPEKGGNGNIQKQMDKLVAWTNSDEFRNMNAILRAAIFHAEFIRIHPFQDGNGRTGRMILNYMLALDGYKLSNIKGSDKQTYYDAISDAITKSDYAPLISLIKKNIINYGRDLYSALLTYSYQKDDNSRHKLKTSIKQDFQKS